MEHKAFVQRVLARLPAGGTTSYHFDSWKHAGRPTAEGVGIVAITGLDPEKVISAVMDVDHYVGNVEHVGVCRSVKDSRFNPPQSVRFYQKLDLPMIGGVHHELVLERLPSERGYSIAAWSLLGPETDRLNPKEGIRSDYNLGCWLAAPGLLAYALSSAPKRDDVGRLKFAALTKGADAGAARIVKANIEGMARWAARR